MNAQPEAKIADFSADWLQREPALALCLRFAQRPTHWLTSVVLIEELLLAMFSLSNQDLARAKLAWWADEADLTVSGAPRHPLTQALIGECSDLRCLLGLTRAAYDWIALSTASDALHQRSQLAAFATAASALVDEDNSAEIWAQLALKRQVQSYAKLDRYGPGVLSRAALAEFQLKASQLQAPAPAPAPAFAPSGADAVLLGSNAVARALVAHLSGIQLSLQCALQVHGPRMQSATRAYALLHGREAGIWAKSALIIGHSAFLPTVPGIAGVLRAWWVARAWGRSLGSRQR